jgi:dihydrofolate reductase
MVFIIAAVTADGFIAQSTDQVSTKWTSKEDAAWFKQKTKEAGVVVMGSTTFETFGARPLPDRLNVVLTRNESKLAQPTPEGVRYTSAAPADLIAQLTAEGFTDIAICGGASIYTQFMEANVVDKLFLTVEPILFGQGISLFTRPLKIELHLDQLHALSAQTHVFEYSVSQPNI